MRILLDTHVWIWTQEEPESLGPSARALVKDESNPLFVSPVSSLELARLVWGGRLTLTVPAQIWASEAMAALLGETAPLTHEIAAAAYQLPEPFHRDPADRILVATARVLDLTLMTADERLLAYPHVRSASARD